MCRYQKNGNMLLYKEIIYVMVYPSCKFYKVTFTMEIHVTWGHEIQTTYVYDLISL